MSFVQPQTPTKLSKTVLVSYLDTPQNLKQTSSDIEGTAQKKDTQKITTDIQKNILIIFLPLILGSIFWYSSYNSIVSRNPESESVLGARRVLDRVQSNLLAPIIYEIKTRESTATCETGFENLPIGTWQGIKRGCYCNDGTTVSYQECPLRDDCRFVSSEDPRQIFSWKDEAARKTLSFCYKKDTEWSRQVSCSSSQTQCASDICKAGSKDYICPFNTLECTSGWGLKKTHQSAFNHQDIKTQSFTFSGVNGETAKCTANFKDAEKNNNRQFVEIVTSSKAGTVCLDPFVDSPKKDGTTDVKVEYPLYRQLSVAGCGEYGELQNTANKLVIDLKSTKKAKDIFTINDVQTVINTDIPENFRNQNYDISLNAVAKIPLALKEQCVSYQLDDFGGATRWGQSTGVFVHVLDWIIIVVATIVLLVAVIFIASLVSPALAQKEKTKIQIARLYVLASFILVFVALIGSLIYFFVFRHYLNRYTDSIAEFRDQQCIAEPKGVNLAIDNLFKYEKRLLQTYGNLISWWFWSSVFYSSLWFVISRFLHK